MDIDIIFIDILKITALLMLLVMQKLMLCLDLLEKKLNGIQKLDALFFQMI